MGVAASASATASRFACLRLRAPRELAERTAAELFEAGACGLEEREEDGELLLIVYAPSACGAAVHAAARASLGDARVPPLEPVPEVDWPRTWSAGLRPLVVSPRLVVRPPTVAIELAPGQAELVIEPRQAFGSGGHATTALGLELLDAALARAPGAIVLDVGCGSGVLALAALRVGAGGAVALDVDPVAARETRDNAERNGLAAALRVVCGPPSALAPRAFDLLVANLLRRELEPWLGALAARVAPGGTLVLSGLLATERDAIASALGRHGLALAGSRERADAGGDVWVGLTARR
jgi:ribosomal protein L11 methyltransferase